MKSTLIKLRKLFGIEIFGNIAIFNASTGVFVIIMKRVVSCKCVLFVTSWASCTSVEAIRELFLKGESFSRSSDGRLNWCHWDHGLFADSAGTTKTFASSLRRLASVLTFKNSCSAHLLHKRGDWGLASNSADLCWSYNF